MAVEQTQWFRATSGLVWGILSLGLVVVIVVLDLVSGWHPPVLVGALLFGAVAYVAMIRPRIGVQRETLVLDHMFSTVRIPVASVESIEIGRTFEARVAGHRYVSAAVGRSFRQALKRQVVRDNRLGAAPVQTIGTKANQISYADFVVERIHASAADARARAGIPEHSAQQVDLADDVRRSWAWPEVVVVAVLAVAFVVSFFV